MNQLILWFVSIITITTINHCLSATIDLSMASYKVRLDGSLVINCSLSVSKHETIESVSIFKDGKQGLYVDNNSTVNNFTIGQSGAYKVIKNSNYVVLEAQYLTDRAGGLYKCSAIIKHEKNHTVIQSAIKYVSTVKGTGIDSFVVPKSAVVGDSLTLKCSYFLSTHNKLDSLSFVANKKLLCEFRGGLWFGTTRNCIEHVTDFYYETHAKLVTYIRSIEMASVSKSSSGLYECRLNYFDEKHKRVSVNESNDVTIVERVNTGEPKTINNIPAKEITGEKANTGDTYARSPYAYQSMRAVTRIVKFDIRESVSKHSAARTLHLTCAYSLADGDKFDQLYFHFNSTKFCEFYGQSVKPSSKCSTGVTPISVYEGFTKKISANVRAVEIENIEKWRSGVYECGLRYLKPYRKGQYITGDVNVQIPVFGKKVKSAKKHTP